MSNLLILFLVLGVLVFGAMLLRMIAAAITAIAATVFTIIMAVLFGIGWAMAVLYRALAYAAAELIRLTPGVCTAVWYAIVALGEHLQRAYVAIERRLRGA